MLMCLHKNTLFLYKACLITLAKEKKTPMEKCRLLEILMWEIYVMTYPLGLKKRCGH